ncbi:MAG: ABC transporter ATP-binding protein [Flavobacteriales bacterium]
MTEPLALEISNIQKKFGSEFALDRVGFSVPQQGIFGLLGPNGAGKTTLLRMLNGITAPDRGKISFYGEPLGRHHLPSIGYLPEERGLYKSMRVGEQALYFAQLRGMKKSEARSRLKEWFERLEVDGWWNKEVSEVSKGMAQKIQFILSVIHEPRLLILDEPLSGFDPINAQRVREVILELKEKGDTTILLSTHDMGSVEEMCDEVALLNKGHLVLNGKVPALREAARDGRIEVTFRGTVMAFTVAIGASAELLSIQEDSTHAGEHRAMLRLPEKTDVAEWLHWITGSVALTSCTPWRPGMREIFIHAVEQQITEMP